MCGCRGIRKGRLGNQAAFFFARLLLGPSL
jgi:hypothetical protein